MSSLTQPTNIHQPKITFIVKYQCFLAVAAILVFFIKLDGVLGSYGITIPLYWMVGFIFLAIPLYPLIARKTKYLPLSIFVWFAAYLAMTSIAILFMPNPTGDIQQILENQIRSMIFICLMLLIFSEHPLVQKSTKVAILLATFFNVCLFLAQFVDPSILQEVQDVPGRSAGFYIDSNTASCGVNMGLIFSISLIKPKYRLFYALFTLLGIAVTFSRGGMACWLLIVLMFVVLEVIPRRQFPLLIISVLTSATIISTQIDNLAYIKTPSGAELFNEGTIERIEFLTNPLGDDETQIEEGESDSRILLLEVGWQKFVKSPWIGNGLGSGAHSGIKPNLGEEPKSHNIYLDRAIEYGFLGILIYPAFLLATIWKAKGETRKYALVFAIFLLVWGIFSHTVLNDFFLLTSTALMAILSKQSRIEHQY